MVDRMRAFAFALPFILAAVVAGVFFVFGLGNWVDATFNGGCLMATPSFVSGMIVQRLLTRNLASFRAPAWVAHAMALATVPLALAGVPGSIMLFYMTMLVFVMVAAEPERPGLLSRPFARNLANASYGFYLLHIPVADIVLRSLVRRLSFPPAATYALAPVAIIVTTMLAVASFRYFEDPLRRYLGSPILRLASKSRIIGDGKHLVKDAL